MGYGRRDKPERKPGRAGSTTLATVWSLYVAGLRGDQQRPRSGQQANIALTRRRELQPPLDALSAIC
jgi:hypothetical protein